MIGNLFVNYNAIDKLVILLFVDYLVCENKYGEIYLYCGVNMEKFICKL